MLWVARLGMVTTLSYAAWRFGGTDTTALLHVAIGLSVALGLCLVSLMGFGWKPMLPGPAVAILPMAFLGYSILQLVPIPPSIATSFFHAAEIQRDFGDAAAQPVVKAIELLTSENPTLRPVAFPSVVPQRSKAALIPLMLATVFCLISSVLFTTSNSRRMFLWCILLHTAALAIWGIIQRSNGSIDILPGIPHTSRGLPFSSFVYRNAGAAAMLPGIAAAIALFSISLSKSDRKAGSSHGRSLLTSRYLGRHYSNSGRVLSVRELVVISLGCVVLVGVIAALSRGAWVAGGLSLVVAIIALRTAFGVGRSLLVVVPMAAIMCVATAQITKQIEAGVKRLSLENVAQDGRWDHWKVGLETAIKYFPFGSGLGTYGYATLPNQTAPAAFWFREAHNQYLEVFTESGLVGIAVLLGAMVWFVWRSLRLVSNSLRSDHSAMGIFGLMVFVCAAVQSVTDFVIGIPANLFLYASFFGFVGSVSLNLPSRDSRVTPRAWTIYALAGGLMVAVLLAHCVSYAHRERKGDLAIAQTPIADLKDVIPSEELTSRIVILDKAIQSQPDRAVLYRHRAMYRLAQYRLSIIETAKQTGETIAWVNTQPEAIYAILAALPPGSWQATVDSLVSTDAMRDFLGLALTDISKGLYHDPLFCQLHLTAAALSPIAGWEPGPCIARSLRLSYSDPQKLYACGVLGFLSDDREIMIAAWRDCLTVSRSYEQQIVKLAMQKLSPLEIAVEMAPPSSPDMLISLVRAVLSPSQPSNALDNEKDAKIAKDVAEIVLTDPGVAAERRYVIAATIFEIAGVKELAAASWLDAVEAAPSNVPYRLKAAKALRSSGRLDEALHQAVLGSSLTTDSAAFQQLASQIRSEIAKKTK